MRVEVKNIKAGTIRRVKKFAFLKQDINYKDKTVYIWLGWYNEVQVFEVRWFKNKFGHSLPITGWHFLRNEEC